METLAKRWENLDPNLQLWILQLNQHFDPVIPKKGDYIKNILTFQFGVNKVCEAFVDDLLSNPRKRMKLELSSNVAKKIFALKSNTPCYALISQK